MVYGGGAAVIETVAVPSVELFVVSSTVTVTVLGPGVAYSFLTLAVEAPPRFLVSSLVPKLMLVFWMPIPVGIVI